MLLTLDSFPSTVLCQAFSITTTRTSPRPPRLINCVFLERANVTCRWKAGDVPAKNYTLKVERMPFIRNAKSTLFTCATSENSCTAITKSTARIRYCIAVIAHADSQDISSERRCQSGRIEVMLYPVTLDSVKPVRGRPQCLNVTWISTLAQFPVADSEVEKLKSQIEFTAEGQFNVQVENVTARNKSLVVCLFRPDTSYTVRLRHRYEGPQSPWSPWSNAQHGRTGEDEPPPLRRITVTPLDDNSLDVRWMAPVDRSPSGFVVEWFAVTEKNNSILYWEKLNGSCKSLVITEGVKPMERYAVSVRALYGEQGAGQGGTIHMYTRQGAPTAAPKEVLVKQITGRTAEIVWSPVPVELLHGFIRNYTISYSKENQQAKRVLVPGHVHHYSLKNLLPGNYIILVQANTDAGPGKAGFTKMHIGEGSDEMSIVMYTLLSITGTTLLLALFACLAQSQMVKQKLCHDVPDPSDSSLAYWTPKTTLENMPVMTEIEIQHSKVVLIGETELENSQHSDPDEDLTHHSVCDLQTYSSPCYPPPARTTQNITQPVIKCFTRAKTTSNADLSSCPSVYSSVHFSPMPQTPPTLLLDSTYQSNHWQHSAVSVNEVNLQLGGDSEPSASPQSTTRACSPLSKPDELKTFRCFLRQHQSPACFFDLSSISRSSVLLSHAAEVTSPQNPFSQSIYKSVQPKTFTHAADLSPFPQSLFVDFSYCPLKCDPYTSSINQQ
ncbi:Interleukin-6 receptor subunit beta [Collichthys lucidus]|uniref:Interleukin-6 receptor subunit beta n=1 Tax=Collichthys lucidus TaxID=240159 RepID=A0A4U5VF65_COLLU|nr:Interleukin-6 receptor subunit beta [Collichthys lucidus]